MVDTVKFSQLPNASALNGTEIVPIVQNGVNVKTTLNRAAQQVYETGTFTPTLEGKTIVGVNSYTTRSGSYTRIGDLCFIRGEIELAGTTGALNSTGGLHIAGLPFAGITTNFNAGISYIEVVAGASISGDSPFIRITGGIANMRIQFGSSSSGLLSTQFTDSMRILFSATYKVA